MEAFSALMFNGIDVSLQSHQTWKILQLEMGLKFMFLDEEEVFWLKSLGKTLAFDC